MYTRIFQQKFFSYIIYGNDSGNFSKILTFHKQNSKLLFCPALKILRTTGQSRAKVVRFNTFNFVLNFPYFTDLKFLNTTTHPHIRKYYYKIAYTSIMS